ncbi:hypothetical protein FQI70_15380 [Escherichia coli]|nr:hypothetical protein [Escherichia coli]RCP69894.1 hypothetical protein APT23_09720 [Escherichia coli]
MAHDVPLGCAPDEYDDLISGTCSHLPCKALAKGTAPAIPALPDLKKGKTVKVCENDNPSMHSPAVKASKSATPLALKQAPVTGRNCCSAASYCRPDPSGYRYRAGTGDWKQLRHSRAPADGQPDPGCDDRRSCRFG